MSKTGTQESPSEHQKTVFHYEGAQQGDGVSILGHIKTLSGHSPGQLALGDPLSREVEPEDFQLPVASCVFNHSVIL